MEDANQLNKQALALLNEGAFYNAQLLLRENAKRSPGHMTLNNLGVFYLFEGMELPGGKIRTAEKLGLRYLKTAQAFGQSFQNQMAYGHFYVKGRDFESAVRCYKAAERFGKNYVISNNLGACYYHMGELTSARAHFVKALGLCDNDADKGTILLSYAFALQPVDKAKCRSVLRAEQAAVLHDDSYEFVLHYLCGDLQTAASMIFRIVDEYAVQPSVVAMMFDCLTRLDKRVDARLVLDLVLEGLSAYSCDMSQEIDLITGAYESGERRAQLIHNFRYHPPTIEVSCYISP